ncbi:hypothetical protein [Archangium lipolyticum]|uniref:hypothetical protein n=1 Tax=Archangium lipolyticum TaxID=2970465 RepID=UPI002149E8BF|nr:hypothetical protein [Archangium lipolyticum]
MSLSIGGFKLPNINLGGIGKLLGGNALNGIKDALKSVLGDFFKSGFDGAKKSLLDQVAKALGLPSPSQANIGAPGAPNGNTGIVPTGATGGSTGTAATGGATGTGGAASTGVGQAVGGAAGNLLKSNPREYIRQNMGDEAAAMYDQVPDEQKKEMAMQAAIQRTARISQLMSNLLQTLHDMSKTIIQNTRG